MSNYFGKAVFPDGHQVFLIYATSPGWVQPKLFNSLDEAVTHNANRRLQTQEDPSYQDVLKARATDEPVFVIADLEQPENPHLCFYSSASRSSMILTGPTSKLDMEECNEANAIYTKEFFDAWDEGREPGPPAKRRDDSSFEP